MRTSSHRIPLACNMSVFTVAQREKHIRSTAELIQRVQNIHEAKNGHEFIFPYGSDTLTRLAQFISNERLCCPFLEFTLNIPSSNEEISLLLTGPDGTQEFLRAEFSEVFA